MTRARIRRIARRIRSRLGLPAHSWPTILLAFLVLIGLSYVSFTLVTDFFMKLDQYVLQQLQLPAEALDYLKAQDKITEDEYETLRKGATESYKPQHSNSQLR